MAMSFHAASTGAAAPRPEFIAELQAKLKQVEAILRAPLKQHRPCSSKERQEHPRLSRRARLRTGAVVVESSATRFATTVRAATRRTARSLPCPPPARLWAV